MKIKAIYKISRTEGIGIKPNSNHNVKYLGTSEVDGFPLFEVEYDSHNANYFFNCSPYEILRDSLIVNTKPGYVLMANEVERVTPLEEIGLPMPTRVYAQMISRCQWDTGCDERLLLMM